MGEQDDVLYRISIWFDDLIIKFLFIDNDTSDIHLTVEKDLCIYCKWMICIYLWDEHL